MILDTSAVIAILRAEPEAKRVAAAIEDANRRRMSAVNFVEVAAVIDGSRDPIASRRLDDLYGKRKSQSNQLLCCKQELHGKRIGILGKRSGHPAKLNFGDCFAYALAKAMSEPLLFTGDNFPHTDLELAT